MKMGQIRASADRCRRRTGVFFTAMALAILLAAVSTGPLAETASAGEPEKQSPAQIDFKRLEGRWVRPDGGYVLELRDIKNGGRLKAAYFNPRPIKVFGAKWNRREGKINLSVELRDINYPGSKYNLKYDPVSDVLQGTYFQAVEKQTFDVRFVRMK